MPDHSGIGGMVIMACKWHGGILATFCVSALRMCIIEPKHFINISRIPSRDTADTTFVPYMLTWGEAKGLLNELSSQAKCSWTLIAADGKNSNPQMFLMICTHALKRLGKNVYVMKPIAALPSAANNSA